MNRGAILVVLLGLSLSIGLWPLARPYFPTTFGGIKKILPSPPPSTTPPELTLSSPDLQTAGILPTQFTCDGRGVSPELHIAHIPSGTSSLALSMIDIDATTLPGGKFYHWGVWNIDPGTTIIPTNSLPPSATIGITSAKTTAYAAPCPISGEHRYVFTVYALRGEKPSVSERTVQQLISSITKQTIASASIVTRYRR